MEMMIVLLIVAIIAAAAAPMLSKKLLRDAQGGSPWLYTLNGSITYNPGGSDGKSAMIGTSTIPPSGEKAKFYVETQGEEPQMSFAGPSGDGIMNLKVKSNSIIFSNSTKNINDKNSVLLGHNINSKASSAVLVGANARTIGDNSVVMGANSSSAGKNAIAIGSNAQAILSDNIAISSDANASGFGSIAIGPNSSSSNSNTIAIGRNSMASRYESIAIGNSTTSTARGSIAIGNGSRATANETIAMGGANVQNNASIAIGAYAEANKCCTGLGYNARATSVNATALGYNATASNTCAIAIGYSANAHGNNTIALGTNTYTSYAQNAIAIGTNTTAQYVDSIAIGFDTDTSYPNQIVLGSEDSTVYIPGDLVVGGNTLLGSKSGSSTYIRPVNRFSDKAIQMYAEWVSQGDLAYAWNVHEAKYAKYSGGKIVIYSDRRLKNVGEVFNSGLDKIKQLKVYNYTFKNDPSKEPRVGVMAQDLKKVFPNAVTKGEDGFLKIRFEDMFYALINAVKELDIRTSALKKENEELKQRVDKLEKLLTESKKDK